MAATNTSTRIEKAIRACRESKTTRIDGKPLTPRGCTRELILALLDAAATKGMTPIELAENYPHRNTPSSRMLRKMEIERLIVKRGERYFLAKYKYTW